MSIRGKMKKFYLIFILFFLGFSSNNFDNALNPKNRTYRFPNHVLKYKRKPVATLINFSLTLIRKQNFMRYYFSGIIYSDGEKYPFNHRQYFKIKLLTFDRIIQFYVKARIHCQSEKETFIYPGKIWDTFQIIEIQTARMIIIENQWHECINI